MTAVSALSNETIFLPVQDNNPSTGNVVINTYPVSVALTGGTTPGTLDWHTATWETLPISIEDQQYYLAKLSIGPASLPLTVGHYKIWIKIVLPAGDVVTQANILTIY